MNDDQHYSLGLHILFLGYLLAIVVFCAAIWGEPYRVREIIGG